MATKTALVQARIAPDLKQEVDGILKELGISASEVINMLYALIRHRKGLPFDVALSINGAAGMDRRAFIKSLLDELEYWELREIEAQNLPSFTVDEVKEQLGL